MDGYDSSFVFCLAGSGQRFVDEGITTPKYLLKINKQGQSLIEKSIECFNFDKKTLVLFICNRKHIFYKKTLLSILKKLNISFKLIFIDDTNGQAVTAYLACKYILKNFDNLTNKPIAFFNGDSILKSRNFVSLISCMHNSMGLIDVFESKENIYSYIKAKGNYVSDIIEKKVISNKASSGLYLFLSPFFYNNLLEEKNLTNFSSEIYISEIYKLMLNRGYKIKFYEHKSIEDTIILGTPDDYYKYIQ
jgi:bifunctional N-acetylglucosamine-1-phosphate-uridyltransferase/glucosamine-1-phosphate-acetyltransferase GlmU-like protein